MVRVVVDVVVGVALLFTSSLAAYAPSKVVWGLPGGKSFAGGTTTVPSAAHSWGIYCTGAPDGIYLFIELPIGGTIPVDYVCILDLMPRHIKQGTCGVNVSWHT